MSNTETNRIEYKEQLNEDFELEVIAFLNYKEGGIIYVGIRKKWTSSWNRRYRFISITD